MIFRSRTDEIGYAKENNIPIPQDDDQLNVQQNLDALCLPKILDVKMTGVITHVRIFFILKLIFVHFQLFFFLFFDIV